MTKTTKKNKRLWNVSLLIGAVSGATLLVSAGGTAVQAETSNCIRTESGTSELSGEVENCGCSELDQTNAVDPDSTITGCASIEYGLGPPAPAVEFGLAVPVQQQTANNGNGGTYNP